MCCQFKKKSVSFYFFLFRFTSWFFFFPKDSTMSGLIKKRKEKKNSLAQAYIANGHGIDLQVPNLS